MPGLTFQEFARPIFQGRVHPLAIIALAVAWLSLPQIEVCGVS